MSETPAPASGKNGLGTAAFVVGLVAVVLAMIPIVGLFIVWVPAAVAFGLGIAAVVRKNVKKVLGAIGLALSIVAVIIAVGSAAAGVSAVSSAVDEAIATAQAEQPKEIVYEVSGDGSVNVTYSSWTGGEMGSESANGVALPWSVTINPEPTESLSSIQSFTLMATGDANSTTVSCKITVDGEVVSEKTSTGAFATVMCSNTSY